MDDFIERTRPQLKKTWSTVTQCALARARYACSYGEERDKIIDEILLAWVAQ